MRRKTTPLPLPRTWLHRKPPLVLDDSDHHNPGPPSTEAVLGGRGSSPGSKAHLRKTLLDQGWDADEVDPVVTDKFLARKHIYDLTAERRPDVNAAILKLKELGVQAKHLSDVVGSPALREVWDSYTRQPWWLSAKRGHRTILMASGSRVLLRKVTAGFVRDIWACLGEAPEHRMPSVRRINLMSFASPEGVNRFAQALGPSTDIIVTSGLDNNESIYSMLSYAESIQQAAPHSVLIYETIVSQQNGVDHIIPAAKRSGFGHIWGVARG